MSIGGVVLIGAAIQWLGIGMINAEYGPDASYDVFIGIAACDIALVGPCFIAFAIFTACTRAVKTKRTRLVALWVSALIVAVLSVVVGFVSASGSDSGRWWREREDGLQRRSQYEATPYNQS